MSHKTLEAGCILAGPPGGAVVMVLVEPQVPGSLRCGGVEMVVARPVPCGVGEAEPAESVNVRAGRRYRDEASGLLVRCVCSGRGRLQLVRAGSPTEVVELVDEALVSCT